MLRQRGHAQMSVSDFDAARATFAKLLSRRPEDPHALLGVGNAELELGKFDIANGFLLQAMSHSETRGGAVLGIGRSHALRGDDSSAKH